MNEKKSDWDDLRLFIAIARAGGLSPAAVATGRSPATLGRRMHALERKMHRELFIRHERGYEVTIEGQALLTDLAEIEARIVRVTSAPSVTVHPLIKVSAGTWTTLALIPAWDVITGTPPDIRLRFISAEDRLDIARREAVIGFRNQRPTEQGLAGRKLAHVEFAPYATPNASDQWIKVVANTASAKWLEKKVGNDAICEVVAPRNSLDLVLMGVGIALLPTFIGDANPNLVRRGATVPELSHDQWIVTHQDDRHLPEVRRAIDRMCRVLKGTA